MAWRFTGLRRKPDGVTRNDGTRVMCQRCRAEGKKVKVEAEKKGRRPKTRATVAVWEGERVEEDGRRTYVAYCDDHFHWWNERRLREMAREGVKEKGVAVEAGNA